MRGLSLLLSVCGGIAALLGWQLAATLIPLDPADSSMAVRLGKAAMGLLPGGGVLAAMLAAQMAGRFAAGAFDPLAGLDTRFLLVNQRVIDNTVEQMALFAPALLALAAGAPAARLPAVLALGIVFALARLLFWIGYLAGSVTRAPGMAASFAVNLATLAAAGWYWAQ